jgi:vacuolar protein sorting-associated protein 26
MPEGHLSSPAAFDFEFLHVEKRFESYVGANVALRYYLRVVVLRRFAPIASERGLWVIHIQPPPPPAKTQDLYGPLI